MGFPLVLLLLCLFATASSQVMSDPSSRLVVNGSLVNSRDHLYAVTLDTFPSMRAKIPVYSCNGTMISKRWVLTTAHCMFKFPNEIFKTKIRVGISDLAEKGQITDVKLFECHAKYKSDLSEKWHNDVSLIKTCEDLEFNETICAAQLPAEDDLDQVNINVTSFRAVGKKKDDNNVDKYEKTLHLRTL